MIELKNLGEVCLSDRELYALGSAFVLCQARTRWSLRPGSVAPGEVKRAGIRFRDARKELGPERAAALEKKIAELCQLIARQLIRAGTGQEIKQGLRRQRKPRKPRQHGPTVFKA